MYVVIDLFSFLFPTKRPAFPPFLFFLQACFDYYTNCFDYTVTPSDDTLFLFPPPASAEVDSDETYEDLQVCKIDFFLSFFFLSFYFYFVSDHLIIF